MKSSKQSNSRFFRIFKINKKKKKMVYIAILNYLAMMVNIMPFHTTPFTFLLSLFIGLILIIFIGFRAL
jgi:hypothetical protein